MFLPLVWPWTGGRCAERRDYVAQGRGHWGSIAAVNAKSFRLLPSSWLCPWILSLKTGAAPCSSGLKRIPVYLHLFHCFKNGYSKS